MGESLHLWLENTWNEQVALRLRVRGCCMSARSAFQLIEVFDTHALGKVLALGGSIVLTEADEAIYSEGLCHPALQCHPRAQRVCILGGGDGGIAREVVRYRAPQRITVVEIDRQLVDAVRAHFPQTARGLDDARVELVIDDAHRWLTAEKRRYDVVIVDADHLHETASDQVHRVSFASAVHAALAEDGVLIAPLGVAAFAAERCRLTLHQLRERFEHVHVYEMTTPSVAGQQWAIAWCSDARRPEVAADAETSFRDELRFWEPSRHDAMFALPRPLRRQLGL